MEIVNNYSDGVGTQRQISETSRESEIVEDAVTETNVDVQENPAYNFRANVESVDYENGEEYEVAVYGFTNIPIKRNPAYKVHNTVQSDKVRGYEMVIPTESPANEIVQQNQANNIITTQQGDTASDYSYEEIPEISTEQFYPEQQNPLTQAPEEVTTQAPEEVTTQAPEEVTTQAPEEVITTQAPVTTPVSPLKAICSFWQGKVEIAVRITILMLAFLLMGLYVSAGQAYITPNEFSLNPLNSYIRVIIGGIFPLQLSIVISMEIVHLCIRTCRIRTTKCFLTWDILYCCMISFFSLVFLGTSAWLTVLWSTTSNLVQFVLFVVITVLCFIFTALYILRVCWIRATISRKWDSRMII